MILVITRLVPLRYIIKQHQLLKEELEKYMEVQCHPVARIDIDEIVTIKKESEAMARLAGQVLGHFSAEGHYLE